MGQEGRVKRSTLVAAVVLLMFVQRTAAAADPPLLTALRAGDRTAVARLLQAGSDPQVRDQHGATALMFATLYASPIEMRQLLERGADVNAANATGATALMWAARDTEKTALLLDFKADVNARTKTETTALIVATRVGNVAAMRLLIARGADVKRDAQALVTEVHSQGDADAEQVLRQAGVDTRDPARLAALMTSGQNLITVGFTERLLARGATLPADNLRINAFAAPLLGYAASTFGLPLVRTILGLGGDPNRKGLRDITPLMMAAAAAEPDPAVVQLLLDKGADVTARDASGRTALDWALLQGDTSVAQLLKRSGAPEASRLPGPPAPVAQPRTPRAAVEAALAILQPAGPKFFEGTGRRCVSCHNQQLPQIAAALAGLHGARLDVQLARHPLEATLMAWEPAREDLLLGRVNGIRIGGFTGTAGYALLGLAEEKTPSSPFTDAVALALASQQQPDGSWNVGDIRPPLFDSSAIHYTALAIRGLDIYMPPGLRAEADARIGRGRAFLEAATSRHTQDEAFTLLGLVWSRATPAAIARQRDRLLALQREDGGWGQRPTMATDAYQTGQVLYALHASGTLATDAVYQRGVRFLLKTQLEDGSWYMPTRAFAFQAYFETGFPHGTNQFISAAATSWAAIALGYAL